MKKKIIVFGLGKMFKIFLKIFDREKVDILALSDNKLVDSVSGGGGVKFLRIILLYVQRRFGLMTLIIL